MTSIQFLFSFFFVFLLLQSSEQFINCFSSPLTCYHRDHRIYTSNFFFVELVSRTLVSYLCAGRAKVQNYIFCCTHWIARWWFGWDLSNLCWPTRNTTRNTCGALCEISFLSLCVDPIHHWHRFLSCSETLWFNLAFAFSNQILIFGLLSLPIFSIFIPGNLHR